MSVCPACNGTGPQGAVLGVVCPRCGGSGVVSDAAAQAQAKGAPMINADEIKSLSESLADIATWLAGKRTVSDYLDMRMDRWTIDLQRLEIAQLEEKCAKLDAQCREAYENLETQRTLTKARLDVYPKLLADIRRDYDRESTRRAAAERELALLKKSYGGRGEE